MKNNEQTAGRSRRVWLTPERRAVLVADAERKLALLRADPGALREVIAEGIYLDRALSEAIDEGEEGSAPGEY
jgi:hypothetical protein